MQVIENMADPERFERPTLRFVVWQQASKINGFWHRFRRAVARSVSVAVLVGIAATPLHAGGPVIEDAYEAEPAPKMTAGEGLALAAGLLLIIAIAKGGGNPCNGDPEPQPEPEPGCR